ncbi:MAG: FmdB family zinc ribbon protein [Betaproteobacteria bacterium]
MPIYAYKCESCGLAKDVLQRMSDPLLTQCPFCGAETFKKQLTAAGFQLKGTGWYATDFKGGAAPAATPAAAATPEGAKPAEAPAGGAAKTEAAPAAAASPAPAPAAGGGCGSSCACH